MKPRHLLRKADRPPMVDPAEALRIRLFAAKHALEAAEKNPAGSLQHSMNIGTARIHAIAALRLLKEAPK